MKFFLGLLILHVFLETASAANQAGFHLYYGSEETELNRLVGQVGKGSVVVIDTRVALNSSNR